MYFVLGKVVSWGPQLVMLFTLDSSTDYWISRQSISYSHNSATIFPSSFPFLFLSYLLNSVFDCHFVSPSQNKTYPHFASTMAKIILLHYLLFILLSSSLTLLQGHIYIFTCCIILTFFFLIQILGFNFSFSLPAGSRIQAIIPHSQRAYQGALHYEVGWIKRW